MKTSHEQPLTVRQLIHAFLEAALAPRREDARHAQWWSEQLGALPVDQLTAGLIRRNVQTLTKRGRSEATSSHYLRFIRRVCKWGLGELLLTEDPCKKIELPKDRPTVFRVLTEDEEEKLCSALGEPFSLWLKFAVLTGLKQSEQFALRWRDIDLSNGVLFLPDPYSRAVVALNLPTAAIEVLQALRRLHPPSIWAFPDLRTPSRPANIHSFYTGKWEAAIRAIGIPSIAWKDLRTTCGVRLARGGQSAADITAFLRQREVRRAYWYKAWIPGQTHVNKQARGKAVLVFDELSPEALQELIGRDIAIQPVRFKELCHLYAAHHLKDRPCREQLDRIYRKHWATWADRFPHDISRKEIRLWYLALEHTPALANKAATLLRGAFSWGSRMELLSCPNPVTGLIRFRQYARERFLTSEEVRRFIGRLPFLPTKPRAFLSTLLLTGARKGEVLKMKWSDLDSETRLWRKSRTKNGTGHVVPLPIQALDTLSQLPRDTEYVFSGQNGQHWHRTSADKEWFKIRRGLGLNDVTLHDLRRSCASYLAIAGENLPLIQNVLNHRSLTPTSVYARLNTNAVDRALQAQADRLCGLVGASIHGVLEDNRATLG